MTTARKAAFGNVVECCDGRTKPKNERTKHSKIVVSALPTMELHGLDNSSSVTRPTENSFFSVFFCIMQVRISVLCKSVKAETDPMRYVRLLFFLFISSVMNSKS